MKISATEVVVAGTVTAAAGLATGDALAALAALVLLAGWKVLVTDDGLLVLFLAFAYQWFQVAVGLFYTPLTGRPSLTAMSCDYRPMVLLGLGCIVALAFGLRFGIYLIRRRPDPGTDRPQSLMSWPALLTAYAISVVAEPIVNQIAQAYPTWRQVLITAAVAHLALLFMVTRRLCVPVLRWQPLLVLVGIEVARGFTGYFAGFREPLILAGIVLLEIFDRRRVAHWLTLGVVAIAMVTAAVMWIGVRDTFRREVVEVQALTTSQSARFDRITDLGTEFFSGERADFAIAADNLVDRMWAVYYPALAIPRVPKTLPHTDGQLLWGAVQHVLAPRIFFPDKPSLISDSEIVRKYSGIWVAGEDQNTSIAFGYAGESYIDFGVPMMFLPSLVFGVLMGIVYAWLVRHLRHVELMIAAVNVIFWLALYLFERSWANTLGNAMSLLVYLAIPIALIDDFLLVRYIRRRQAAADASYAR